MGRKTPATPSMSPSWSDRGNYVSSGRMPGLHPRDVGCRSHCVWALAACICVYTSRHTRRDYSVERAGAGLLTPPCSVLTPLPRVCAGESPPFIALGVRNSPPGSGTWGAGGGH